MDHIRVAVSHTPLTLPTDIIIVGVIIIGIVIYMFIRNNRDDE